MPIIILVKLSPSANEPAGKMSRAYGGRMEKFGVGFICSDLSMGNKKGGK